MQLCCKFYFSVVQLHHLVDNAEIAPVLPSIVWGSLNILPSPLNIAHHSEL